MRTWTLALAELTGQESEDSLGHAVGSTMYGDGSGSLVDRPGLCYDDDNWPTTTRRSAMAPYGITREFPHMDYDEAVARVTEALKSEGFGVLTEINVKATLKKKLDVDFERYVILGACSPPLAHKALSAEPLIGLLLPCNVVVKDRQGGGSVVSALDPRAIFTLVGRDDVKPLAEEVAERLQRVMDAL